MDDIPEHLLTEKLKKIALRNNSKFEKYFEEESTSEEICIKGISEFKSFPEALKTPQVFLSAFDRGLCKIYEFPKNFLSEEVYFVGIKHGLKIRCIPERFISERICFEAVKRGEMLRSFPERFISERIRIEAIKRGEPIQNIPERFRTREIYFNSVLNIHCEDRLQRISKMGIDVRHLYGISEDKRRENFKSIPKEFLTREFCIDVVKKFPFMADVIPVEMLNN